MALPERFNIMKITKSLQNRLNKITKKARRIFMVGYEDISTQIFYDSKETFRLLIVKNSENLIYEKKISRSQAFRIMNTR